MTEGAGLGANQFRGVVSENESYCRCCLTFFDEVRLKREERARDGEARVS